MSFLISILTSSNPELARLCYDSVTGQQRHDWDYHVLVDVNSRNPEHEGNIRNVLSGTNAEIVVTDSNGRPGKGHNSLIQLFRERLEFDYLVLIDGDDFLYPTAFHQLSKYLPASPQCLAVQTNDSLTREKREVRHANLGNDWQLVSWFDDCENWWSTHRMKNPFTEHIRVCATPARPILLHRSALAHLPRTAYGEEFRLYDDMIFFLNACEAWYRRPTEFRLFFTSNTYIYLHNDMNPASMSNATVDYDAEHSHFMKATQSGFESIRRWQLNELPHIQISNPEGFGSAEKIAFAKLQTEALDKTRLTPHG